jgi:hypothetical protein
MRRSKNRGSMSAYMLLTMGVLLTASVGVSGLAVQSLKRVRVDKTNLTAQQAASSALELAVTEAVADFNASSDKEFEDDQFDYTSTISSFATGATAEGEVEVGSDPEMAWITGEATYGGVTRSVRAYIKAKDVGIWNNVIFAGTGGAGKAINGNVDIRGSVHILGDGEYFTDLNGNGVRDTADPYTDVNGNGVYDVGEPFTDSNGDGVYTLVEPYNDTNANGVYDPPLTQTDLSTGLGGTGNIGNNYSGMPAALEALLPAAPVINGKETLSAELRVKHGKVGLSGTATVGEPTDLDGGSSKGTVDGTYVNDGWAGNAGSANAYSDNGTSNGYDLGTLDIDYPVITGIGSKTVSVGGTTYADHQAYLDANALVCPITTITATTAAFTYGPDAKGNAIAFLPQSGATPARLVVTGIVKFNGNVQIGAKDTIRYAGKGTIYSSGNVNFDGNFLPMSGFTFPTATSLGVIAKQDINLATGAGSSQLSLAGAFYAQGTIRSAKQNQIAGTFVANYFDMGSNVPNIYQVPKLKDNLPPGMPGADPYFSITSKSWRDRSSGTPQYTGY